MSACNRPSAPTGPVPTDLDGLIQAAKAEGEVDVYGAVAPEVLDNVTASFKAKYGIDVKTVRLGSSALYTRFATEAQSGNPGADVILPTFGERDVSPLIDGKLITPLQDATIPGYPSDFPEKSRLTDFGSAAVDYVQNGLAYNTDQVKKDQVPTDWSQLADLQWKDKIVAAFPNSSPNTLNFFNYLLSTQGASFLQALRANGIRFVDGESPAIQSVAAGEGAIAIPGNSPFVTPLTKQGAPIAYQSIEKTSGLRIGAYLAAKAKHPAAARLFLHYVLSQEGAATFTGEPGTTSPYDTAAMEALSPEQPTSSDQEAQILSLLGAS